MPAPHQQTADLIRWLRAQIDEDDHLARRVADSYRIRNEARQDHGQPYWPLPSVAADLRDRGRDPDIAAGLDLIKAYSPARVLAEVAAKREAIDLCWESLVAFNDEGEKDLARDVLRLLAVPYADRPGYRDEWRPR